MYCPASKYRCSSGKPMGPVLKAVLCSSYLLRLTDPRFQQSSKRSMRQKLFCFSKNLCKWTNRTGQWCSVEEKAGCLTMGAGPLVAFEKLNWQTSTTAMMSSPEPYTRIPPCCWVMDLLSQIPASLKLYHISIGQFMTCLWGRKLLRRDHISKKTLTFMNYN